MGNMARKRRIMARNEAMYGKELGSILTKIDEIATDPSLSDKERADKIHAIPENNSASVAIRSAIRSLNPVNRVKAHRSVKKLKEEQAARASSRRPASRTPRRRRPS